MNRRLTTGENARRIVRGETRNERPDWPLVSENQLATQTKLGDDGTVTLHIVLLDVVEHATTTTNHHEKTSTTVVVLLVRLQVAREVVDALGKDGDLHFGRTRIGCVKLVRGNRCLFVWQVNGFLVIRPIRDAVPVASASRRSLSRNGPVNCSSTPPKTWPAAVTCLILPGNAVAAPATAGSISS
jgi:hypothetical protein